MLAHGGPRRAPHKQPDALVGYLGGSQPPRSPLAPSPRGAICPATGASRVAEWCQNPPSSAPVDGAPPWLTKGGGARWRARVRWTYWRPSVSSVPFDVENQGDATSGDAMTLPFTQLRSHIVRPER